MLDIGYSIIYKTASIIFPQIKWSGDKNYPSVYLTFDDGPHPDFTSQILEILNQFNAKATFFLKGSLIDKYPVLISRIHKEGHSVGLHGMNHSKTLFLQSQSILQKEILNPQRLISTIIGYKPQIFRPPYGRFSPAMLQICKKHHIQIVLWSVLTRDYDPHISSKKIFSIVKKEVKAGSIVLFHDGLESSHNTVKILPDVIEFINKKNLNLSAL